MTEANPSTTHETAAGVRVPANPSHVVQLYLQEQHVILCLAVYSKILLEQVQATLAFPFLYKLICTNRYLLWLQNKPTYEGLSTVPKIRTLRLTRELHK